MNYGILLRPHANGRYQEAVRALAVGELKLLMGRCGIESAPYYDSVAGTEWIRFECAPLTEAQIDGLSNHSALYLLCEMQDGLFRPLASAKEAWLGQDLSGILKYKGKTNEAFTRLLINYAACSARFDQPSEPLTLLDPMCGRGTTLFEALNRGYNCWGVDISQNDLNEGYKFLKKYLEYHHIKHKKRDHSLTLPGGKSAAVREIGLTRSRENSSGEDRTVSFVWQDAALALKAMPEKRFHLAVCDLPYGVQHGPGGKDGFDQMLKRVLPQVLRSLKPGGALALSFNTYTLPSAKMRGYLAGAGFEVCESGPYEGLEHWVEQAIVRDIAVGVKRY